MNRDTPNIIVNHVGFFSDSIKSALFPDAGTRKFQLQNMMRNAVETLGDHEDWEVVFEGDLAPAAPAMGQFLTGDFTAWQKPGTYRLVLPEGLGRSYVFTIQDGVFSDFPRLLLDYYHSVRCGAFENHFRGPCHLDDGVLSESGVPIDATGGWHDAGDTRKWMVHCVLPALAMTAYKRRFGRTWNHWSEEPYQDDLIAEIAWGIEFILKVRNPETGMIYEDVGGGGEARKKAGMTWWYENHAGCCADNSENRFTDNVAGSGDERLVRERYNPIVQYTNITILLQAVPLFEKVNPGLAVRARLAAFAAWRFVDSRKADSFHDWTSVRSWRVLAALEIREHGECELDVVEAAVRDLLDLRAAQTGFWHMDATRTDFYRGILHSAQPLIALASFVARHPGNGLDRACEEAVRTCVAEYVGPMRGTNPFGIIPFGCYATQATSEDHYRKWKEGVYYRFFMPANSRQKVNHGLGGHWTSWAHALALCGDVFGLRCCRDMALDQLYWLLGKNPAHASFLSGIGYNHPMPHSRPFGYLLGGFMIGPRGVATDEFYADTAGRADWSTCEYWTTCGANTLLALSYILPDQIASNQKLGLEALR
jgi:hypothetical protein